jgi:KDO2-lipid IV(A) lauroyltransferase
LGDHARHRRRDGLRRRHRGQAAQQSHFARYVARQRALLAPKDHIGKQSGARRIFVQLRGGKSVYMLVDQKNNEGVAVPFFGRVAMTNPVPAALSLKLGAHLFLVRNRRTRGARFEVTIMPGPDFTPSGNSACDILALTAAITARIEQIIREDPAAWLWIHNRWPRTAQAG